MACDILVVASNGSCVRPSSLLQLPSSYTLFLSRQTSKAHRSAPSVYRGPAARFYASRFTLTLTPHITRLMLAQCGQRMPCALGFATFASAPVKGAFVSPATHPVSISTSKNKETRDVWDRPLSFLLSPDCIHDMNVGTTRSRHRN